MNLGLNHLQRLAMDVSGRIQASQPVQKDVLGERAQKMFQDFLEEWAYLYYMYIEFESEALSIANSEYFAKARIAIHNSNYVYSFF